MLRDEPSAADLTVARGFADLPVLSDEDLFDAWCQGDRDAGDALVARHLEALQKFVRKNAGAEDLDEVIQNSLLRLLKVRLGFRRQSSFRTYLFGVTLIVMKEHRRGMRTDADVPIEDETLTDDARDPSEDLLARERGARLVTALERIPAQQRVTFVLRYRDELTVPAIARLLGDLPTGTVRSRIRLARQRLRAELADLNDARG